jgi:hypothetical protein
MRRCLTCCIVAAATLTASAAFAQTPADMSGTSASVLVGYGTDSYNLGFGARVSYTLPAVPVYIGGTFVYHLGTSETIMGAEASAHVMYFGAEAGYNVSAGPVVIRPYLGLGAGIASATASYAGISYSNSDTKFSVWPGATLLVPLGPAFVGADVRYFVPSGSGSFGIFGTAGLKF